jgi:hypothetical protein
MPIRGEMKFDKRIAERNVRVGLITEKELKNHLASLPDLTADLKKVEAEIRHIGHDLPGVVQTDEDEL